MEKVFGFKNGSFTSIGREEMERKNDERQMGIEGFLLIVKGNYGLWAMEQGYSHIMAGRS